MQSLTRPQDIAKMMPGADPEMVKSRLQATRYALAHIDVSVWMCAVLGVAGPH